MSTDRRGHTLLEVIVAGVLLLMVFGSVLFSMDHGQRVMGATMQKGHLESQAQLAGERMVRLLRQAGVGAGSRVLLLETAPATDTPLRAYTRSSSV